MSDRINLILHIVSLFLLCILISYVIYQLATTSEYALVTDKDEASKYRGIIYDEKESAWSVYENSTVKQKDSISDASNLAPFRCKNVNGVDIKDMEENVTALSQNSSVSLVNGDAEASIHLNESGDIEFKHSNNRAVMFSNDVHVGGDLILRNLDDSREVALSYELSGEVVARGVSLSASAFTPVLFDKNLGSDDDPTHNIGYYIRVDNIVYVSVTFRHQLVISGSRYDFKMELPIVPPTMTTVLEGELIGYASLLMSSDPNHDYLSVKPSGENEPPYCYVTGSGNPKDDIGQFNVLFHYKLNT
jgi:hypothetical protein